MNKKGKKLPNSVLLMIVSGLILFQFPQQYMRLFFMLFVQSGHPLRSLQMLLRQPMGEHTVYLFMFMILLAVFILSIIGTVAATLRMGGAGRTGPEKTVIIGKTAGTGTAFGTTRSTGSGKNIASGKNIVTAKNTGSGKNIATVKNTGSGKNIVTANITGSGKKTRTEKRTGKEIDSIEKSFQTAYKSGRERYIEQLDGFLKSGYLDQKGYNEMKKLYNEMDIPDGF